MKAKMMSFLYTDTMTQQNPLAKTTSRLCQFVMSFISIKIIH